MVELINLARNNDERNHDGVLPGVPSVIQSHDNQWAYESEDDELENYNMETAIYAWKQIRDLTHEITSSLMAKQASILCKRCRDENIAEKEQPSKKRRVENSQETRAQGVQSRELCIPSPKTVTTDEEFHCSSESHKRNLPLSLCSEVERIGRMSKLVMEIEFCQEQLAREMQAMDNDY